MTVDRLFAARLQAAWHTGMGWAKRAVFGSHSLGLVVLYFLAAYLYTQTAESLAPRLWTQLAAALLTAAVVAPAAVRTFLRSADLALLAPSPYPMAAYLRTAFFYNLLVQTAGMLLLAVIVRPVYEATAKAPGSWLVLAACLIFLKAWSLDLHWRHVRLHRGSLMPLLIRWAVISLFLFGFWTGSLISLGSALLAMAILTGEAAVHAARYHLPWPDLIEKENKRIDLYYSILNMFIDVPHKRKKIRVRSWAVRLFDKLTGAKQNAYLFLLVRHVLRTGETFSIYLRLSAVTWAILAWAQSHLLLYTLCLASLAAAGKQVTQHMRTVVHPPAIRLLPISPGQRQKAARRLCLSLLWLLTAGIAAILFSKTAPLPDKLALTAICLIWSVLLTHFYLRGKPALSTNRIPLKR